MTKKIVIGILIVGLLVSLFINYVLIVDIRSTVGNENSRIHTTSAILRIFNAPIGSLLESHEILEANLPYDSTTVEYLEVVDSTINNLRTMMEELANSSGGLDPETGGFINGYSTALVTNYFYKENPVRNEARIFFNETLSYYVNKTSSLGIEETLLHRITLFKDYHGGALFNDMTVFESIQLLHGVELNILSDKTLYLTNKQE